ncbi:MAG: hypothetical protein IT447_16975, partial [Phycisphaerales bacterium]|nr:hypothetical protein [Phycisphaerales bacterium]
QTSFEAVNTATMVYGAARLGVSLAGSALRGGGALLSRAGSQFTPVRDYMSSQRVAGEVMGSRNLERLKAALERMAAKKNLEFKLIPDADSALAGAGGITDTFTRLVSVTLGKNPTRLEVLHEFNHARTAIKMGPSVYSKLSVRVREQIVYDALRYNPRIWGRLTAEEQNLSHRVIESWGGISTR